MTDIIRFCPLATLPFTLDLAHSCGNILDRLLRSSSGLGHRPLTAKIAGSNPVRSTKKSDSPKAGQTFWHFGLGEKSLAG